MKTYHNLPLPPKPASARRQALPLARLPLYF
jgi:hypothetical protein